MKALYLIIISFFIVQCVIAQDNDKEQLRKEGYEARLAGDLKKSIERYSAVLKIDSSDYDAKLALGRLYLSTGEYKEAIRLFDLIYKYDTTDVEAMFGFGIANIWLDQYSQAIFWLNRAVDYLPNFAPAWLELGRVYSYAGKLDSAIRAYEKVLEIDSTHTTAWAGIGRMYYWKSMPVSAVKYYKKALEIDPEDKSIKKEYEKISKELKWKCSASLLKIQEKEPSYVIDALIQRYSFSKRLKDRWMLSGSTSFDYSERDVSYQNGDTTRWFDNTWLKLSYLSENNNIAAHLGYSSSDEVFSTYGISWTHRNRIKKLRISNTLTAAYSYFYYWKQAGKNQLSDNLSLKLNQWEVVAGLTTGIVDEADIREFPDQEYSPGTNPFLLLNSSVYYQILKKPRWKLGATYSFYDFKYRSPDYYTPYSRNLYGPVSNIYYNIKDFYIYVSFSYMLGTEIYLVESQGSNTGYEDQNIDVDNWSGSFDIGYNFKLMNLSVGGGRFVNPFYENYTLYFALRFDL
jgi:tetratricopeptide (TPR) repeat protein